MQAGFVPGPAPRAAILGRIDFAAAVHHHGIAGMQLQALGPRNLLQFPAVHGLIVRNVRLAPVLRHVEKHAPGHQAGCHASTDPCFTPS